MKVKFLCLFLCLSLAACTENGFLLHSNGKSYITRDINGVYKIGDRYQVNGIWYQPREDYEYKEVGIASWYGPDFHKGLTANGETYNMYQLTAAHKTLPLPSLVKVTNLENGKSVVVRVNDRGPFVNNRIIDVSKAAAIKLGFVESGTAKVRVEIMKDESKELKKVILDNGGKIVEGAPIPEEKIEDLEVAQEKEKEQAVVLLPDEQAAMPEAEEKAVENKDISESKKDEPIFKPKTKEQSTSSTASEKGYFIQLAAFKNYDNALALKGKFSQFEQVKIVSFVNGSETLYRVRIGPFNEPEQAVKIMDEVKETTKYKDMRLVEEK